jgi:hypothetical protein
MDFNPKDANANLIQSETWCEATIATAEDTFSKQGNQMIAAGFQVFDEQGEARTITHYFVAHKPGMFKNLCLALKLDFDSGSIPAGLLIGKKLAVLIKIQTDKTGQYGDKNVIAAFADKLHEGVTSSQPKDDDGIPF